MPGDFDPDRTQGGRYENWGAVNPLDPSVANGQITPEQWAEYQRQRHRAAVLGWLGTLGGTTAASWLASLIPAAGPGFASVPGAVGASAPPLGAGTVTAGTLAATPFTALTPLAGTATRVGTDAAGGTIADTAGRIIGAGGDGTNHAIGEGARYLGLTPRDWLALGTAGAGTIGGALSDRPNLAPNTATSDPQLARLLQSQQRRLDMSEPLYASIVSMANGLLPTQYQHGGSGPTARPSAFGGDDVISAIRSLALNTPGLGDALRQVEERKAREAGGQS